MLCANILERLIIKYSRSLNNFQHPFVDWIKVTVNSLPSQTEGNSITILFTEAFHNMN